MQIQSELFDLPSPKRATTQTQQVAQAWMRYASANALKPKTKAYKYAEHAFLSGIAGLLREDMPQMLSICLASGRSLESIIERTQPR